MFAGLCAFPLTPMDECGIDEAAFVGLVARLAQAGVDSIGALGSTGSYAYLQAIKAPAPPIAEVATRIARLRELVGADAVVGVSGTRARQHHCSRALPRGSA
jgi:4-hydroxy-tetrahydrodipicolinate synthase